MLHSIIEDDVVILIEIIEATTDIKRSLYDVQAKVMGYAFLKLILDMKEVLCDVEGCRGTRPPNIGCKLQTFKWQRIPWFRKSHLAGLGIDATKVPKVFTQFLLKRKSMLSSHLYIEIEASENVVNDSTAELDEDFQFNHDGITDNTTQPDRNSNEFEKNEDESILASYKRPFNDKCQLPDELFMKIDVCNVVTSSLSNSGDLLVIATHDKYLHIYNISEPKESSLVSSKFMFMAIRSICWSSDDSTIACCGDDNRVLLIRIERKAIATLEIQYTSFYLDPYLHPSALTFHPIPDEPLLLIGVGDGSFYSKITSKRESKNCFQKFHEQIHKNSIDAIVCNMYNGRIITGDSIGKIVIWKPIQVSSLQSVADFTVLFQFTVNKPILHLSLRAFNTNKDPHSLLITARNKTAGTLIVYDLISHEMRPFSLSNAGNDHDFCFANYSPDFKYVIAATRKGKIVLLDSSGLMRKHVSIVAVVECWLQLCFRFSHFCAVTMTLLISTGFHNCS